MLWTTGPWCVGWCIGQLISGSPLVMIQGEKSQNCDKSCHLCNTVLWCKFIFVCSLFGEILFVELHVIVYSRIHDKWMHCIKIHSLKGLVPLYGYHTAGSTLGVPVLSFSFCIPSQRVSLKGKSTVMFLKEQTFSSRVDSINPFALRKAKIVYNIGLYENNRSWWGGSEWALINSLWILNMIWCGQNRLLTFWRRHKFCHLLLVPQGFKYFVLTRWLYYID